MKGNRSTSPRRSGLSLDLNEVYSLEDFIASVSTHLTRLKESGQPLLLTVEGGPALVVQDALAYQELLGAVDGFPEAQPAPPGKVEQRAVPTGSGMERDGGGNRDRGIVRIDQPEKYNHGWWVRRRRGENQFQRFFPDKRHGGKEESLEAARQWNEELDRNLPPINRTGNSRSTQLLPGFTELGSDHDPDE